MVTERPGVDERIRALLESGNANAATTEVLRTYGPELLGFLSGVLGNDSGADEVFALVSERIWRFLPAFQWRCGVRTWVYAIARNESARFLSGERRRRAGRANPEELEHLIALVRTETWSFLRTEKKSKFNALREELSADDRMLLILRVDRGMPWEDVAVAFGLGEGAPPEELQRETARLRKRFQLVKKRIAERARQEGLIPG
jgi:RNA polymerase sigma-70 factor (ECF subfamily)